jgi:D-alanyl-D-alanine carboxypeptidase (penicillin-binding protein 5/6)
MRPTKLLLAPLLVSLWQMSYLPPAVAAEPRISALSALLMDAESAEILYEREAHTPLPMASTTKVMTGLLGVERLRPFDLVRVSLYAASKEPSKLHLKPGEVIRTDEILPAILLKSANDASAALAERISGSEEAFARLMTRRARELGAHNTRFENASGLPADGHYSTAYDLAILLRYAMQRRDFADIMRLRTIQIASENGRTWMLRNHNRLLWTDPGALGGKTGWTRASKHCYVGMATRNGRTLIVSVLGSTRLWDDVRELLSFGFADIDLDDARVVLSQPIKLSPPPSQAPLRRPPERRPAEVSHGNAAGYTVQVGAFREKKRAEMLRQRLRKHGYSAYVTMTGSNAARLYRVRVGEFDTPLAARRVVGRLKTQMGLEGLVATAE